MYDETARFELHEGLREALGESRGDTLMGLLPPVGWADVATKQDVDQVSSAVEALRVSTQKEFELVRMQIDKSGSDLESRIYQAMNRQIWAMLGFFTAMTAVVTAANKFL